MTDKRILIIDDDTQLLGSLGRAFLAAGWTVDIATSYSGVDATEVGQDWGSKPDVVLCDWDLGLKDTLNGGEIVEALRERWGDDVRYIIWSGLDRDVPDGVEFRSKANLSDLLDELNGS